MRTCSNCGAAARDGAKFCTSCGARLPIVPTGESSGWGDNADQTRQTSTWETAPANGQQMPPASETPTVNAAPADQPAVATDTAADRAENGSSSTGTSSAWSWGQTQTDETAVTSDGTTDAADREDSREDAGDSAATDEPNWISSWTAPSSESDAAPATDEGAGAGETADGSGETPAGDTEVAAGTVATGQQQTENAGDDAQPEWMRSLAASQAATSDAETADATAPATTDGQPETAEDDAIVADANAPVAETVAAPTTDDRASDATAAATTTGDATSDTALVGTSAASSGEQTDTETPANVTEESAVDGQDEAAAIDDSTMSAAMEAGSTAPVAAAMVPATPAPAGNDALSEAEELLDRLHGLLPTLATAAATPPGVAVSDIADRLQQAADQNANPEFDDLASVLEAAREHPRDVDTMLTLVARIDPMLALLRAHGDLLTAIHEAVTDLRDESPGQ